MRTPPPAVPGIADANSSPPSPASRARCRQTAFFAPPPATSVSPSTRAPGELAFEPEDERVDALVGGEHVRAEPDRLDRDALGGGPADAAPRARRASPAAPSQRAGPPVPIVVSRDERHPLLERDHLATARSLTEERRRGVHVAGAEHEQDVAGLGPRRPGRRRPRRPPGSTPASTAAVGERVDDELAADTAGSGCSRAR